MDEKELALKGWVKKTTTDEPRLSELVDMYEQIGLEVRLEPFDPRAQPGCSECMKASPEKYMTIYTRRPTG